ncbi:ribosomal RNA small subunit methyltransferase A, partial [Candidatus Pelagibacter bacterium]|nr:ribosomal RNA small subunit methyltransferase A [Candidatus Pelagibacter bacterium]
QILVKIIKLKKLRSCIDGIIFMFQKELGEKIISKFPSPKYGRLSILTNLKLNIENKFLVSPNCFVPRPKVTSMVIYFKVNKDVVFKIKKIENLELVTNILFSNKRKMINKNIKKILDSKKITKIKELKLNVRPTELGPKIFYKITELFEK